MVDETRRRLERARWIIDGCDARTNALFDGDKRVRQRAHDLTFKVVDENAARKAERERRAAVREAIQKVELNYHTANTRYVDKEREERDRKSFEPSRRPRRRRRRRAQSQSNWNS
jgi:hypothetical protein